MSEQDMVSFSGLILGFSSAALSYMGLNPAEGGKSNVNLPLAKQNIAFISMLQEKTQGNLKEDEEKLISQVLLDLKLKFAEASKV